MHVVDMGLGQGGWGVGVLRHVSGEEEPNVLMRSSGLGVMSQAHEEVGPKPLPITNGIWNGKCALGWKWPWLWADGLQSSERRYNPPVVHP